MSNKRSTLASTVVDEIVEYIKVHELQPGDKIPNEMELASLFNVGRGTIREAVKQLVAVNTLNIVPARGTFVSKTHAFDEDPLGFETVINKKKLASDLIELRIVIDGYASRLASLNATEKQIESMREILTEIDENLTDNDLCLKLDIDFHKLIAEASGNTTLPLLSPVIHSSFFHFDDIPAIRDWPNSNVNSYHWTILNAIESRNPVLAEAEMIRHLSSFKYK